LAERAVAIARRNPHGRSTEPLRAYGAALATRERFAEAEQVLREALGQDREHHGPEGLDTARSLAQLANDDSSPDAPANSDYHAGNGNGVTPAANGNGNGATPPIELNHFPRNKIARLPKETRDSIDQMLGQALPAPEILQRLGEVGKTLNRNNLWRWKKGPHQKWLKHQQRLEDSRAQLKFTLDAVRQNQSTQIHEATQQIVALRISELLTQFDLPALKQAFLEDRGALVRFASLLPKLSQGGLECERQRLELAERQAALDKRNHPKKIGISPEALRRAEQQLKLM